jgi:plastocyanin
MQGRAAGAAAAIVAALALPAAADAATKTVQAGPFGTAALERFSAAAGDANQYFRGTITIHRGDKVKWNINGFHSVTFVPKGDPLPGLIAPDTANPIAGSLDAANQPFWFNGQPNLAFNPLAAAPQGGASLDPDAITSSGLPGEEGPPPPYTLKFPKTGTFTYVCTVHPGMDAKVKVVKPGRPIPSAKKDRKAARKELAKALKKTEQLSAGQGTEDLQNAIQAGNDRAGGATVFKFFPAAATVKAGDTITLQMPPSSSEVHSFTFGPSNGENLYVDLLALGLVGEFFDPRGALPSEPPAAGVPTYTPALHGNGFWNSGLMDSDDASPLPPSTQVKFGAAGTFAYICVIHPFMRGEVTVTP